jgi:hypothetical protein
MEVSAWVQTWWSSHAVLNVRQYNCRYTVTVGLTLFRVKLSFCLVKQNVVKVYEGVEVEFLTFWKLELQVGKLYDSASSCNHSAQ